MRRSLENMRKFCMPFALRWGCGCFLLLFAFPALGQEFRAVISGEVSDPSGAAVSGAKVAAHSVERNATYEAVSSAAGRYIIQFLLPGSYTVTVEKSGFRKFLREGVVLLAGDKPEIDVKLELGSLMDTVTVSGATPLLQTESANRQAVVE